MQVLAVDLLNPTPQAEARKHKLKVRFDDGLWSTIDGLNVTADSRTRPTIIFHGRQVSRLLHNHHRLLARTDSRCMRRLLAGALPTDRWKGSAHRRLLVPEKVEDG